MHGYTAQKSNLQVSKISGREFAGMRAAFATAVSGRTVARADWRSLRKPPALRRSYLVRPCSMTYPATKSARFSAFR